MIIISTWRYFLLYALDIMSKDDCSASMYILVSEQVKYDGSLYTTKAVSDGNFYAPAFTAKSLWPPLRSDQEECIRDPRKYRKYLEDTISTPGCAMGQILQSALACNTFMFVPDIRQAGVLVHCLQEFLYDTFGLGSMWFNGAIDENDPNEYIQDDKKVLAAFRRHAKEARMNVINCRGAPGAPYIDSRRNMLNEMTEGEMRDYLKKYCNTDTAGMDASTVYALMYDLFVEEANGESRDSLREDLQKKYRKSRKRKHK